MRLIDADEIVKIAEHAYNEWNLAMAAAEETREINKVFEMQELCKAVKAVADNAPTIDPESLQPQWIPVTEGLPEDGTYLCTMDGELVGRDEPFTGMCGIENGVWDEPGCVLAWMPLPEPYCEPTQNGNGECEIEIKQPNRWLETV